MRKWLRETHGPGIELLRHFLLRFFDSDIVTTPGQVVTVLIGGFSVLLPWFPVLIGPLRMKYRHFAQLATPGPFRQTVRADELWLITLMMSAIGLLTAVKWQALFPSLRDYRALGSLPIRARQIFIAKLLALLLIATAAIAVLNLFPALLFPEISGGRWSLNPSLSGRVAAHVAACVAASYFFFFAMVAIQGVLLNLFPPRQFGRIAGSLQGILVALMLILIILSFSIQARVANAVLIPAAARWLPPVWFLGLNQTMLGDPEPTMHALANQADWSLAIAAILALLAYLLSYRRHRVLLVEGVNTVPAAGRQWSARLLDLLVPRPRQRAIAGFMARTLSGSSQHRTVLMGYCGFGLAILISGLFGLSDIVKPANLAPACFIYAHVILLVFLLLGLRHLFAIPTKLKANWIFQLTEGEGRMEWQRAIDRFVWASSAFVMIAIPLPFEIRLLGWRAASESVLFAAFAFFCYEAIFASTDKLPFTCSYLPGKTPMLGIVIALFGLITLLPVVNAALLASLSRPWAYILLLALTLGIGARMHRTRIANWSTRRLKYDDLPQPVIHSLNLA